MSLVVPDNGELVMLAPIITAMNASMVLNLRLYQNNYTPVQGSGVPNFAPADFSGYSSTAMDDWGAAATVSNKAKTVCASNRTFSHNGGGIANTIYGYFVVWTTTNIVLFAERFASPITMAALGDIINIKGALTLNSEN